MIHVIVHNMLHEWNSWRFFTAAAAAAAVTAAAAIGLLSGLHFFVERNHRNLHSSISCLTNLRSLQLIGCTVGALTSEESEAIAQLTQLTELRLGKISGHSPCYSFWSGLQQLQELAVGQLSADALPVLASLTQLTIFECDWQQQSQQQQQQHRARASRAAVITCPSVKALVTEALPVPFESFPGLSELTQGSSWPTTAFVSLAQNCKQLRQLHISSWFEDKCCLRQNPGTIEPGLAIRSLSALQQLTWLSFVPKASSEVRACKEW
jgi:hypothetical protein